MRTVSRESAVIMYAHLICLLCSLLLLFKVDGIDVVGQELLNIVNCTTVCIYFIDLFARQTAGYSGISGNRLRSQFCRILSQSSWPECTPHFPCSQGGAYLYTEYHHECHKIAAYNV